MVGECAEDSHRRFSKDLVVISAYRPNPPSSGESTVWAQHQRFFNKTGRTKIDPREAFTQDLSAAITKWRNQGCEIILGVDANEDLSKHSNGSFRSRMHDVGLSEAILSLHHTSFQATYQRNKKSCPIDGLFTSTGVKVQAGGYYGFDEFVSSDHRALWLDFDLKTTLGGHTPEHKSFHPRKLVSTDKSSVRRYLRQVEKDYWFYDIPGRLDKIQYQLQQNGSNMTPSMQRKYNCLHDQMYMIRRKAENSCRKIKMGKVPWSPKMQVFWDRIALWRILIKGRTKCRVSSRKVRRLMKKSGLPSAWKLSLSELQGKLKEELVSYRKAKKHSAEKWRKEHLDAQLRSARKRKWKNAKSRERFLRLRRMKQREEARRRRRARGKGFSGGLRTIQIEEKIGETVHLRTITDRELVEEGCRSENTARYDQTRAPYCTPPMQPLLYDSFAREHAEESSFALLEGRYQIPSSLDYPTKQFLSFCRIHPGYKAESMAVSHEDHCQFWSRNKETKGSEPHGLHNGHFKAALDSPLISRCDSVFRNIPVTTGFVPDNWKHLMNFAIEKKPGEFRLSKMRTIQMMNSEFQANNKKMGKTAMRFAETNKLIPPGQCGARKRHQAIDLALSKRLIWDMLILQRRTAGWISNDAKSCFDRVVHWVAIIALLRFGITWRAVSMAFDTLASASHRVRTGYGDSETVFAPPSDIPFQGCGQGNGAGPAIWVAVSSIIITMMEASGFGFECLSPIELKLVSAQCLAFIDDTDLTEAAKSVDNVGEDICESLQKAATLWAGGIRATGGAVNPDKSFWWFFDWEWDAKTGTWPFRPASSLAPDFQLKIPGLSGALEPLRRLAPSDSERTLGVMMAPLENEQAQIAHLQSIAKEWAENIRPGHLQRYDVFPLIRTTILKSLGYPMALTTLDQETWRKILSPVLQVCLPKAGFVWSFPQRFILAPLSLQGAGIPHPFAEQVCSHLDMLLRHPANRSQTNSYLEANLQAHQLETGTSFGILQQTYDNTAILASDTWLKRVWKELDSLGIYVAFDFPSLELHREGDALLMELFMDLEVDQPTLKWLNWCRLFLHVCTVSDITTADGRFIRKSIWEGCRDNPTLENYQWPRTARPSNQHWDSWRAHLSRALLTKDGARAQLRTPLGPWTDDLARWNWLYSSQGLFHRTGTIWHHLPPIPSITRSKRFSLSKSSWWLSPLPSDVRRATIHRSSKEDEIELSGVEGPRPTVTSGPTSLHQCWQQAWDECTSYYGWVPDEIEIHGSEENLLQALKAGKLRCVSDGSYQEQVGTAAAQLLTREREDRIILRGQVPGRPQDQSPYRSELAGLLMPIMVVEWMAQLLPKLPHPGPIIRIGCDGLSALEQCFEDITISPTDPQFDLVSTIRSLLHRSSFQWRPLHILGHQDTRSDEPLTWWEIRNTEVDRWAVMYRVTLDHHTAVNPPNPRFFAEPAALFIGDCKQSSLPREAIQERVSLPLIQERWRKYSTVSAEAEPEIHWSSLRRAMHALPPFLQRWIIKHSVGITGVGRFLKDWGHEDSAECPCCGDKCPVEDHLHIPRCSAPSVQAEWDNRLYAHSTWLDLQLTHPGVKQLLLCVLRLVREPHLQTFPTTTAPLQCALHSQLLIGSQGLLEGRLSHRWVSLQQEYYRLVGSRRSGHLWASRLSQQLIMIGHYLWSHRNSIKHSEESVQARRQHRWLDERIHTEFEMGIQDLPAHLHCMMKVPIRKVLRKNLDAKEDWVDIVSTARSSNRRSLSASRRALRTIFRPPLPSHG